MTTSGEADGTGKERFSIAQPIPQGLGQTLTYDFELKKKGKASYAWAELKMPEHKAGEKYSPEELKKRKEIEKHRRSIETGDPDALFFVCSVLSVWTLAAAGLDVTQPVIGPNGKPVTWSVPTGSKKNPFRRQNITLRALINLEADAVEAMTIAMTKGVDEQGSVGPLSGSNVKKKGIAPWGPWADVAVTSELPSIKGAPGVFEIIHIGKKIEEGKQMPGDFAQALHQTPGPPEEAKPRYRGAGHAWQVWAVQGLGAAMFGQVGSPAVAVEHTCGDACSGEQASGATKLKGWHEDVEFVISRLTDPSLVGSFKVNSAWRFEARREKELVGVPQSQKGTPVLAPKKPGDVIFYGRLNASPWNNWKEATRPVSPSGPALPTEHTEQSEGGARAPAAPLNLARETSQSG